MTSNVKPAQAETTDVANVVRDGKLLTVLVAFKKILGRLATSALRKDSLIMPMGIRFN
jgi:hypothetical protein